MLGGDHSISFPVVRAVSEKLGGPVDILHLDAHPDIYHAFEGNKYSHASSFARIMEGGYARRLLQVMLPYNYSFLALLKGYNKKYFSVVVSNNICMISNLRYFTDLVFKS